MARIRPIAAPVTSGEASGTTDVEHLSRMSHELRTPLNAIIGFAEMSERQSFGALAEPYLGYASSIRNAAEHLLHVVNDLMDLAAVEAERARLAAQPVNLAETLAAAKTTVAERATERGVDLTGVAATENWCVMGDPDRLRRIFVSLLGNAGKFTPAGGSAGIVVAPTRSRNDAAMLDICVWDTGIGVPHDEQAKIFEVFHTGGGDAATLDGAGLGLSIARRLAQLMGGDLTLESSPNQGSRFILTLPAADTAAQAAE